MSRFKSAEIFFRRLLVRALKLAVKRRKPPPAGIDFNECKFLFIRQDRIGDVIVSSPLYSVLKKHYPGAIVDFFLSAQNHFVLDNDPLVRRRWVYTKTAGNAVGLIRAIRREKYDFVIDLMDDASTTSTIICALANGSWNVGLCKENAYVYDIPVEHSSRRDTHIVDRTARVLTAFGIDPAKEKLALHYRCSNESALFARSFLEKAGLTGKPILAVNVSPARGVKYWGKENFCGFLEKIVAGFSSLSVLVLFQPTDKGEAKAIAQSSGNVILSPETKSFDRFAALLKHASFLVTPDTSAVHLAAAFQIPAVALHFQPDRTIRIWEPYGVDCENLVSAEPGLQAISPGDVFRAFGRLYERSPFTA